MMIRQLLRTGDTLALALDDQILDQMGIGPSDAVEVRVEGQTLIVQKASGEGGATGVSEAIRDSFERNKEALRRLAK